MSIQRRKVAFTVIAALVLPALGWWILYSFGYVGPPGKPVRPPFNMSDRIATIDVVEGENGELIADFGNGMMTADQFFRELHARKIELPKAFNKVDPKILKRFDITSMTGFLWLLFGLLAQGVFAGRMIVQWYASEKAGASIVPNLFWWMSLIGSSMCIIYFIWRKELVGILGQSTGWLIYVRNLWMIYGKSTDSAKKSTNSGS